MRIGKIVGAFMLARILDISLRDSVRQTNASSKQYLKESFTLDTESIDKY